MAQPQHTEPAAKGGNGVVRFSICALGICVCYMYYGIIQESLFRKQKIGPSFVLLVQCITNSAVARIWLSLDQWVAGSTSSEEDLVAAAKKKDDDLQERKYETTTAKSSTNQLHHPLLAMTSLCYVSAMVCSNEALHFVSYPTAVLAKSCKLIPTMAMGVLVERRIYQWIEWMAALCITAGIVIFNFSRLGHTSKQGDQEEDESSWVGLTLLSTSLLMDGFLGSCQGLLKKKRSLQLPNFGGQGEKAREFLVRPPNAVETMLFVNLYAIVFLIPLTLYNQQMSEGLAMLQGSISSNVDPDDEVEESHRNLLMGLVVINMTVAVGQIFIFLTITWYSSLVCTTITTTRKFFTILLSVVYFGHHFTSVQWVATGLVFSGLYLGIAGQRSKQLQQKDSTRPMMDDFSTTHFAPKRQGMDVTAGIRRGIH